jgi:prevent-host-death family protein
LNVRSVSIEDARKTLGELVDRARIAGEAVLITRYNKPAAVLVSTEWYTRVTGEAAAPEGGEAS